MAALMLWLSRFVLSIAIIIGLVVVTNHRSGYWARRALYGVFLALVLLLASVDVHAACTARDAWTGQDKTMHAEAGAGIAAAVTLATKRPAWGFAASVAAGIAKEAYDARHPQSHTCSLQDAAVTAAGAAVGAGFTGFLLAPIPGGAAVVYVQGF